MEQSINEKKDTEMDEKEKENKMCQTKMEQATDIQEEEPGIRNDGYVYVIKDKTAEQTYVLYYTIGTFLPFFWSCIVYICFISRILGYTSAHLSFPC